MGNVLLNLLNSFCERVKKYSASHALHRLPLTRLINSIKHERSCQILYVAHVNTARRPWAHIHLWSVDFKYGQSVRNLSSGV